MDDVLVSVVTGTYNRIRYLKAMVTTVRSSIGVGLPYEIVLVDGGSTDGTQAWCKTQEDIVFIEQNKLVGAVKAFSAGFAKAKGKYVIIANDDIVFMDDAIIAAVAFMEIHIDVGIGCFCQDRGEQAFHVEFMSAVLNGQSISVPYGQVCIVPRELGDKVGWWGNYLHTYAGDNELSCNMLELGYRVEPVEPCACVHDYVVKDDLRVANMGSIDNHPATGHPDSNAWVKKWTRNGKRGPIIGSVGKYRTESVVSRVLYAPIYDPSIRTDLLRTTKYGLREALAREFHVVELDYYDNPLEILDVAERWKPDIFLLQLQDSKVFNLNHLKYLMSYNRNSLFISWNGDFISENILDSQYMAMMQLMHLPLFVTTFMEEQYKAVGIDFRFWEIGYEDIRNPDDGIPTMNTPKHDVLFLGNAYYPDRVELGNVLRSLKGINVGIYGNWKRIKANGMNIYDFADGMRLYRNCKIAVSDCRKARGYVSNRLFQELYAGAFVLQKRIEGMEELIGLQDGVHLVIWDTFDDLKEKIVYWLDRDEERKKIAEAGQLYVSVNHSFDVRVQELEVMMAQQKFVFHTKGILGL